MSSVSVVSASVSVSDVAASDRIELAAQAAYETSERYLAARFRVAYRALTWTEAHPEDRMRWRSAILAGMEVEDARVALAVQQTEPVARLHIRSTDTYPDIRVEVLNGDALQPEQSPISVYVASAT